MKRVCKSPALDTWQDYVRLNPDATWEQARDGRATFDCRVQAVQDQYGLCAYCEQKIAADDSLRCHIEHFHQKSDEDGKHNWGLDWGNMFAVCDGGSYRSHSPHEGRKIHPLPENLSCDAYKNHMVLEKELPVACEGHLLNPLDIPSFPNLFALNKGTGHLKPDEEACATVEIPRNACGTTAELVNRTIAVLNLNCERLAEKRRELVVDIDQNKKVLRKKNYSPAEVPKQLVRRYLSDKWPEFFTTLRCLIGAEAESYLESVNYQG